MVRQPVDACEAHEGGAGSCQHDGEVRVHPAVDEHLYELAPVVQCAFGFGVDRQVLQPRHGHTDRCCVLGKNTASKHIRVVWLPSIAVGYFDRYLGGAGLFYAGANVIRKVLVVVCSKRGDYVLLR